MTGGILLPENINTVIKTMIARHKTCYFWYLFLEREDEENEKIIYQPAYERKTDEEILKERRKSNQERRKADG